MRAYFVNIFTGIKSFWAGMSLTFKHLKNKKDLVATLQYPNEKWPLPDRNIGYDNSEYNVIRSRLHVDMDDCIGCLQCERACPVDCIKIDVIKPPKDSDFDCGITSFGTQKKLVVPRFTIDMSECMYCNLCVYPCPEECIYMVGGPNSEKHDIDYEFSKYNRDGLIFEFATATDKDIIEVDGRDYIEKRELKKKKIINGINLEGKEDEATEEKVKLKSTPSKSITSTKPDFTIINEIEDRVVRSIAKKAFTIKFKQGATYRDIAEGVKVSLTDADKYSSDFDSIIERISTMESTSSSNDSKASDDLFILKHKAFNELEDKMHRGIIKKIFMAEKKLNKTDLDILKTIRKKLKGEDKLTEEVTNLLKSLMIKCAKKSSPKVELNDLFDIKLLNDIEDKMTRGLAKKVYTKGKREKAKSIDIVTEIETIIKDANKMSIDVKNILTSIKDKL